MRQLSLFKGKRQRGAQLPAAKEFALHCMLADVLRRWCNPDWLYTHIPLGEHRDAITGARLKRMGTMRGWPDFIFIGPQRAVFFLELKRRGGTISGEQRDVAMRLEACGCSYRMTDNFDDAVAALRDLGIVRVST